MDYPLVISSLVFFGMVVGCLWVFDKFSTRPSNQESLRRHAWIDSYRFPSVISSKVSETYPHVSSPQLESVLQGLRQFFHICLEAGPVIVAMPSQVVDVAWHEFILSTRAYDEFCQEAFGRFLHHTPAEGMKHAGSGPEGIKRAWKLSCALEGLDPRKPQRLPLLFALDADLNIPNGFKYSVDCTKPGSHPYCGSHIGCSGGGCGTGDAGGSSAPPNDTGGESLGVSCSAGCGGGCGGGD